MPPGVVVYLQHMAAGTYCLRPQSMLDISTCGQKDAGHYYLRPYRILDTSTCDVTLGISTCSLKGHWNLVPVAI